MKPRVSRKSRRKNPRDEVHNYDPQLRARANRSEIRNQRHAARDESELVTTEREIEFRVGG